LDRRKKKIILLLFAMILCAAAVAGSTMFDEDVSTGNRITTAVFDLKVNGKDEPGPIISMNDVKANSSYVTEIPVRLIGTGRGELEIIFRNIRIDQGVQAESEDATEPAPLNEQFYVSVNGGSRSTLKEGLNKSVGYISGGETTVVVLKVEAKSSLYNAYQGDSMTFDIAFRCNQK
jgi:hypothetical protein